MRYDAAKPVTEARISGVIEEQRRALGAGGRLIVRPSGTEPVIRVMGEGDDRDTVEKAVDSVCEAIRATAAA